MAQFLASLRSRWRWLIGLLLGLLVLVAALPSVCQYDPARRWLLGAALDKVNGDVAVERVSFGWFSPPALYGLKIVDRQSEPVVTLVAAQGGTPLWRILMRPHAPGTFHFEQPHVHLVLREDGTTNLKQVFGPLSQRRAEPQPTRQKEVSETVRRLGVGVSIHNARLSIRRAGGPDRWEVGPMNFAARLVPSGPDGTSSQAKIDGGPLLDRTALTPGLCNDVLKFIVPIFADVATAEGEVSVTLEPWHIPLDHPEQSVGGGQLTIHVAKVGAGPLARKLAAQFGIVDAVEIADQAEVKFQMRAGRVYHEGLAFGLPGYRIRTSGSVGFDESLDLVADVPVPLFKGLPVSRKVLRALSDQTVQIRVFGTLEKPELDVQQFGQSAAALIQGTLGRLAKDPSGDNRRRKDTRPSGDPLGDFLNRAEEVLRHLPLEE
jgi:hypothetical protein